MTSLPGSYCVLLICLFGIVTESSAFVSRFQRDATAKLSNGRFFSTAERILPTLSTKEETKVEPAVDEKPLSQVKTDLLNLLATMTGEALEFRQVEAAVNRLEGDYAPIQTLDFFNLLQSGSWQLLFSTQLSGTPNPAKFRLRELTQTVKVEGMAGQWQTRATWDLAPASDAHFTCSGTFGVQHSYEITQGSRCSLRLQEDNNFLELAKGSAVPEDVEGLVGLLHRAMPAELFDATGHSADTTYLDDTLRIVRYTGGRLEGVRDIFLRRDSFAQLLQEDKGNEKDMVKDTDALF